MKNRVPFTTSSPVLAIGQNKGKKRKASSQSSWKGKSHVGSYGSGSKAKPNFGVPAVSDLQGGHFLPFWRETELEKKLPKVP